MVDLLFDRITNKWTGIDREKQPYETIIRNVDVDKLSKVVQHKRGRVKKNKYGQTLYILPQPDEVEEIERIVQEETTEVTDTPVMEFVNRLTPYEKDGEQVTFRKKRTVESTDVSDFPIMVRTAQGTRVQKTNRQGEKLYFKQVPYGREIPIQISKPTEIHKERNGSKLYYKEVEVTEEIRTKVDPLEISEDDELYESTLDPAVEEYLEDELIWFKYNPKEFTFKDVVDFKEKTLLDGTFGSSSVLYEVMAHLFQGTVGEKTTIGYDYIAIDSDGQVETPYIGLPIASRYITIVPDVTEGDLLEVDLIIGGETVETNSRYEYTSDNLFAEVKIVLRNKTKEPIRIESIGIVL